MELITITSPSPNQVFWKPGTGHALPITVTGTAQNDRIVVAGTRRTVTVVNDISVQLGDRPSVRAALVEGPINKMWSATLNASAGDNQTLSVTASGREDVTDSQTPEIASNASFSGTQRLLISVRVRTLVVTVAPYPVPPNKPVTVTVTANDHVTGQPVSAQVLVGGKVVGTANLPFAHTFRPKRKLVDPVAREWDLIYPTGVVQAAGYPDTEIDFGLP